MALWFFSPLDDPVTWRAALRAEAPDLQVIVDDELTDPALVDCALVYKPRPGALARLPGLKAIFSLAAGVDRLLADPTLPPVPVCRMIEPSLTATISDFGLAAVLRVHRGLDRFERHQRAGEWRFELPVLAEDVTVAILGLGTLGQALALRLLKQGYRVIGWSRSGRPVEGALVRQGSFGLAATLGEADIAIGLLPNTDATTDLFDAAFFAAMKAGAHFINLGRGEQLVDDALLQSLASGHLAGATLDVFREEPLPTDHPFWAHPQILITPHVAGSTLARTAAKVVVENVRRLRDGRPLLHEVDRELGY